MAGKMEEGGKLGGDEGEEDILPSGRGFKEIDDLGLRRTYYQTEHVL
jgi:hypothetical protein